MINYLFIAEQKKSLVVIVPRILIDIQIKT